MKYVTAAALVGGSIALPFVAFWLVGLVLTTHAVRGFIYGAPLTVRPVFEILELLLVPGSAALGFLCIVRLSRYETVIDRRALLVGIGLLYFPVMCFLMVYWSLLRAGGI